MQSILAIKLQFLLYFSAMKIAVGSLLLIAVLLSEAYSASVSKQPGAAKP